MRRFTRRRKTAIKRAQCKRTVMQNYEMQKGDVANSAHRIALTCP
nr:hypothetical protein [uncultured Campylobacter sp.]